MNPELRILIVGGYGIFGGRLVELLEDDARLTLLVAGRSLASARKYCEGRPKAAAKLVPTLFDRTSDDKTQLAALNATVVVDASGPFQAYGSNGYRLIEQCIACKVHYLDLADGSDFVAGIAKFDVAARAAGVYVLSGVSSFPVLTAAVVRRLSAGIQTIQSIRGGIAPSPYAGVGLNVIRAIASYSGQKIPLRRSGRSAAGSPFTESMWFVIAVPGRIPLQSKRFSLVDVPDLRALAELWPQATDVWMGAGPVPVPLHWALTGFAWLVRIRLLPNLSWMAGAMHFVTNHVRWGEHRGGMFVEVAGRSANGESVVREWHLQADGDDGPLIPCMAVEAVIGKALAGDPPPAGARTAISDVDLSNYEALFARRTIYTGVRERAPHPTTPLYERILGQTWAQ
jgi:Saccharopine dehydrogenase NADP binding domain